MILTFSSFYVQTISRVGKCTDKVGGPANEALEKMGIQSDPETAAQLPRITQLSAWCRTQPCRGLGWGTARDQHRKNSSRVFTSSEIDVYGNLAYRERRYYL